MRARVVKSGQIDERDGEEGRRQGTVPVGAGRAPRAAREGPTEDLSPTTRAAATPARSRTTQGFQGGRTAHDGRTQAGVCVWLRGGRGGGAARTSAGERGAARLHERPGAVHRAGRGAEAAYNTAAPRGFTDAAGGAGAGGRPARRRVRCCAQWRALGGRPDRPGRSEAYTASFGGASPAARRAGRGFCARSAPSCARGGLCSSNAGCFVRQTRGVRGTVARGLPNGFSLGVRTGRADAARGIGTGPPRGWGPATLAWSDAWVSSVTLCRSACHAATRAHSRVTGRRRCGRPSHRANSEPRSTA